MQYKNKRRKNSHGISKGFLILAALGAVCVMALSAVVAVLLYQGNSDEFTENLGGNLAELCSDSNLSHTQLKMIECADLKNVQYQTAENGEQTFYAEIRLICPQINCGAYSGDKPNEYLSEAAKSLFDKKWQYVSCEIAGIRSEDGKPIINDEYKQNLIKCVNEAWDSGKNILDNENAVAAMNDALCPEPFENRKYRDSTEYTLPYSRFLDKCSAFFAENGIVINGEKLNQSPSARKPAAKVFTPYFCSASNLRITSTEDKNGILLMTFDSLNIIQSMSDAKSDIISSSDLSNDIENQIISSVTSDISRDFSDNIMNNSIEIDFIDFASEESEKSWSYYNILQIILEYYGSCANDISSSNGVKTVTESTILEGASEGQWPVEFKRAKGDGDVVINLLRINKEKGTERSIMKLYLKDSESYIVCLSQGTYRFNIATGKNYFGLEQLFGDDGIYIKSSETFEASDGIPVIEIKKYNEENYNILECILDRSNGGNCINKSAF